MITKQGTKMAWRCHIKQGLMSMDEVYLTRRRCRRGLEGHSPSIASSRIFRLISPVHHTVLGVRLREPRPPAMYGFVAPAGMWDLRIMRKESGFKRGGVGVRQRHGLSLER